MDILTPLAFVQQVQKLGPRQRFVYYTGSFAFQVAMHSGTIRGMRLRFLANIATTLEDERLIFLASTRIDEYKYDYYAIARGKPLAIPKKLYKLAETKTEYLEHLNKEAVIPQEASDPFSEFFSDSAGN